ncbi:MAG: VOC family protein [Actinomycetota bacterium]
MSVEIDHLVVRAPSLETGIEALEARTGVTAAFGGAHPGMGTRNALLSLGPTSYLEIIVPDPEQPVPPGGRPFGVTDDSAVELVSFAVHPVDGADIDALAEAARSAGYDLGPVVSISRQLPEGGELRWRLTFPPGEGADPVQPFLIDWGAAPSPAGTTPTGCTLRELSIGHPDPGPLRGLVEILGLDLRISAAEAAVLVAEVESPNGPVTLTDLA